MSANRSSGVPRTVGSASAEAVPAVRLEDVHVTYELGDITVEALRGVTLDVRAGDFLAIQGPSGSGKSTLLRVMAGLWPATSGHVSVAGIPLSDRSDAELAVLRRRRIGFLHQLFNLLPDLTASENVALPLLLDGLPAVEADGRVDAALDRLGVRALARRRPEEISGGEMLRVALARALVIDPLLVLADEPTGSLDHENSLRVMELFREVHARGDVSLVVVTHDAEVAARAERRLRIVDGKLAAPAGG